MNRRSRRQFLVGLGSALAVGGTGCVSVPSENPPNDPAVREIDAGQYRAVPRALKDVLPEQRPTPFAGYGIGNERVGTEEDPPHCVWVWNVADSTRELTLEVSTTADTVFEHTASFEPESCLAIVLFTSAAYTVAVAGGNWRQTESIEQTRFDCNASATDIAVLGDGHIESGTVTQTAECG